MTHGTDQLFANRYRLERRLGVGGMSTVQLAFDTRLERYVAVKLLAEHLAADNAFVARFRREALSAARLVHPNVVQVYDFGTDEASGRQFIVMEHVEGESCAELLRDHGAMSPEAVVDICTQACRGLDYAHRNGVVHRDVKPGNLLRNRESVVKLADFGIAKATEDSDITRVGSVIGTAAYLSPEQARGEPAGPAADLYALGVVAYQLSTGRLPYQGASLTDLARQQEAGPPTAVHQLQSGFPEALSLAIARALHRDPAGRYSSAAEMEKALDAALDGIAPPAAPMTAATTAMANEDATRVLSGDRTQAMPPQRRLQPVDAPPRRRAAAAAPAAGARHREPARWGRRLVLLIFLAGAAVAGVVGYTELEKVRNQPEIQQIEGDLEQSIESLRDLINENTR
jgi:serine/threonine-protein kinase